MRKKGVVAIVFMMLFISVFAVADGRNGSVASADRVIYGMLKVEVQGLVTDQKDGFAQVTVKVRCEPLIGMQVNPGQVTPEELQVLARHHVNTISTSLPDFSKGETEVEEGKRISATIHESGMLVFWLMGLSPVGYAEFLPENTKETYKVDWRGVTLKTRCFRNPDVKAAFDKALAVSVEKMRLRGILVDGIVINEPGQKSGEFCYCAHCRKVFKEKYGVEMPQPVVTEGLGSSIPVIWPSGVPQGKYIKEGDQETWKKMVEFYCDPVTERISTIFQSFRKTFPRISCQVTTITDISPYYGIDFWNGVMNLEDLDGIYTAIYWAVGGRSPDTVGNENVARKFIGAARKRNISCYYWLQGYDCGDNSHPLKPGEIKTAVKEAFAREVNGVFIWSYLNPIVGPWDQSYHWAEYFEELADAVAPYLDRPAEQAKIVVGSGNEETVIVGDGTENRGKDGVYRLRIRRPGDGVIRIEAVLPGYASFRKQVVVE